MGEIQYIQRLGQRRLHEAIAFTSDQTGFSTRLIENDYYCSLILERLAKAKELVFRGGTCLAKVHLGFYRMSEDLDFLVSIASDASRSARSQIAAGIKPVVAAIEKDLPDLRVLKPLTGANSSRQYNAVVGYKSLYNLRGATIKIDVGLRDRLMTPAIEGKARTLLLDPLTNTSMVAPLRFQCLSRVEIMAEKISAALDRREVAIRDFYDVDYAVRHGFRLDDSTLIDLVARKLAVPGNNPMDVSQARLSALRPQLESELKPTLRAEDFAEFDLNRAWEALTTLARALERTTSSREMLPNPSESERRGRER